MFAFTVARRYLFSNPAQTALLISGVALGVMAFVFITALIGGLAIRLTDDVTANSAHITLEPETRIARVLPSPDAELAPVAIISTFQRRQIRAWTSTPSKLCQPGSTPCEAQTLGFWSSPTTRGCSTISPRTWCTCL